MKKLKINLLMFSTIILMFNCKSSNEIEIDNQTISIQASAGENDLLSETIDDMEIIYLETNDTCMISDVDKLRFHNNKFYVFDETGNKRLLCFDKEGNFQYQIGRRGKANGEYLTPRDMNINPWLNRIEIYDVLSNKILFYSFSGEYLGYYIVEQKARSYTIIDSLNYGFFVDANFESVSYNFCTSSTEKFSCKNKSIDFLGQQDVMNGINLFNESVYGTLFSYSLSNNIYRITSQGALPAYTINYNNISLPDNIMNSNMGDIVNYLSDKKIPGFISHLAETSKHISFSYTFDCLNENTVYYSKESGKTKNLYKPINNINGLPLPPPFCTINDTFVTVVPAYEIILAYNEMKLRKESSESNVSDKAFNKLQSISSKLSDDSNPIIIMYTIKDF